MGSRCGLASEVLFPPTKPMLLRLDWQADEVLLHYSGLLLLSRGRVHARMCVCDTGKGVAGEGRGGLVENLRGVFPVSTLVLGPRSHDSGCGECSESVNYSPVGAGPLPRFLGTSPTPLSTGMQNELHSGHPISFP